MARCVGARGMVRLLEAPVPEVDVDLLCVQKKLVRAAVGRLTFVMHIDRLCVLSQRSSIRVYCLSC